MRSLTALLLASALVISVTATATAAPVTANKKNDPPAGKPGGGNGGGNNGGGGQPSDHSKASYCSSGNSTLSLTDVTFGSNPTVAASDCYGAVGGNDDLAEMNSKTLFTFSDWTGMLKDDGVTFGSAGLTWGLDAAQKAGTNGGSWTLTLSNPAVGALPLTTDLMVVLKAGSSWAAYLFNDMYFKTPGSGEGAFAVNFENKGGQLPALSHMSVYFRDGRPYECTPGDPRCAEPDPCAQAGGCDPGTTVPEPTTMVLTGLSLLGASFAARRRR